MAKKRVSLTLSEELVKKIDDKADRQEENRSRTIEHILGEYFSKNALSTAVIFCGDKEAKCLEEYNDKTVLEHILSHLVENRIEEIYLLAGQNEEEISEVCRDQYAKVELKYISEDEPRGTAAALRQLENEIDETFLAVNGHVLTDVDLEHMYQAHRNSDSAATIALTSVNNPSTYGVARLKGDKILGFEEKPDKGEEPSNLINAGTYILKPEIFQKLNRDEIGQVFENLAHNQELSGYIYGGKWIDLSN